MKFSKKAGLDPTGFISTTGAAEITGIHRGTFRNAIIAGDLEAFQTPSGKYIIPISALDEWLTPVNPRSNQSIS